MYFNKIYNFECFKHVSVVGGGVSGTFGTYKFDYEVFNNSFGRNVMAGVRGRVGGGNGWKVRGGWKGRVMAIVGSGRRGMRVVEE